MAEKPTEKATLRESLTFFAKLIAYLFVLFLVAYAVFALTRSLQIHR